MCDATDYFGSRRGPQILDRTDQARIAWGDDPEPESSQPDRPTPADAGA